MLKSPGKSCQVCGFKKATPCERLFNKKEILEMSGAGKTSPEITVAIAAATIGLTMEDYFAGNFFNQVYFQAWKPQKFFAEFYGCHAQI